MKRTLLLILLLLMAHALLSPVSPGYAVEREDHPGINVGFAMQDWFSTADAKWQISFGFANGTIESELDFKKIDSPVNILTQAVKVTSTLSYDLMVGRGIIHGGHGTDTDSFISSTGGGLEFSQSQNDVFGDTKMWGGNLYFKNGRFAEPGNNDWGMVVGFLHYEDNLIMQNAVQTISQPFAGLLFPPIGPFPANQALRSTYDFSWNAFKVGVTRQAPLTNQLSYSGMLSLYPLVIYRGEGFWNLRTGTASGDFRTQSPNFIQTSSTGYGYEAVLGLTYAVSENVAISAGYRYLRFYANNGTDTTFFADGSAAVSTLDWVTVTREGAYADVMFKF